MFGQVYEVVHQFLHGETSRRFRRQTRLQPLANLPRAFGANSEQIRGTFEANSERREVS